MKQYAAFLLLFFIIACRREDSASVPDSTWMLFRSPETRPLTSAVAQKLDGIYTVEQGQENFGTITPAKWSYTVSGADTLYHFSFFLDSDAGYIICEGRRLDSTILLDGYWRKRVSTETGKVRLTIARDSGAAVILRSGQPDPDSAIVLTGVYGTGANIPDQSLQLRYTKAFSPARPFQIIAHRGGGRTADLLPASENSVEMIRLASRFGSTGVEIDVRMTKDGVPILYHDATLNGRVVQNSGLLGPIENYTYDQLSTVVRLTNGERIPTLRQALETIVYQTPLQFVWLDMKYDGPFQAVRNLQAEFLQKAEASQRQLEIVFGLPDEIAVTNFKKLPGYQNIPSLVEFSPQEAAAINARIWAPQWTLGLQTEEVDAQQAQGRRVFTWTMDIPENVERYMREGGFNGIISNYPSILAYHYYVR
jgi:glycerophosphoryl diester phosphodiesterase